MINSRTGKIIVAPNAFKGSLSALKAAEAIAAGIKKANPGWKAVQVPLADGGDGTTECIIRATGGRIYHNDVTGPAGETVSAYWGLTGDGQTAVVEIAAASGLALVSADRIDPLTATSYGTGELIREALGSGCRTIFLGLGGSATSDAGAGILQALGARLIDGSNREIGPGALGLKDLRKIDPSAAVQLLHGVEIIAGCDVDNPLYGPSGAAYVYADQKGASPEQISLIDQYLRHFARIVEQQTGRGVGSLAGGGAAGGTGAGLAGVLGARLVPGIEQIMELSGLPKLLAGSGADLVITGEGEINRQSLRGKGPVGVARLAARFGVPVLVLAGSIRIEMEDAMPEGITVMLSITDGPITLAEAMARTAELLESTARRAILLFQVQRSTS